MSVLICKNISSEGPGTIGDYLTEKRIPFTVIDLDAGDRLPDADSYSALVMLGGPMSVNEDNLYPYITEEEALTRDFIAKGKKVFGVCLGAQIMAKALGAKVYKGPAPEIGWLDITLSSEAIADPLMRRLAMTSGGEPERSIKVFHWHGETFDIPAGGVRLAGSDLYPNQGFRVGSGAYAFQFHIEVTGRIIDEWMANEKIDLSAVRADTARFHELYHRRAYAFYDGFFSNQNAAHRR